jgi:hypothetical protein
VPMGPARDRIPPLSGNHPPRGRGRRSRWSRQLTGPDSALCFEGDKFLWTVVAWFPVGVQAARMAVRERTTPVRIQRLCIKVNLGLFVRYERPAAPKADVRPAQFVQRGGRPICAVEAEPRAQEAAGFTPDHRSCAMQHVPCIKCQMRRAWFLPIGLVAPSLGLSACHSGISGGPKVAVNGDSITVSAVWPLNNTLAPAEYVHVHGQGGLTIAQTLPELQTMLTDPEGTPNDVIVESGTNDVFQRDTTWQAALDTEVGMLASTQCVIFVNVSSYADWFGDQEGLPQLVPGVNAAIAQVVSKNPHFHLLDWNAFITQPGNFEVYIMQGPAGLLVHPNAAGQQVLANMEQQALQQDCRARFVSLDSPMPDRIARAGLA